MIKGKARKGKTYSKRQISRTAPREVKVLMSKKDYALFERFMETANREGDGYKSIGHLLKVAAKSRIEPLLSAYVLGVKFGRKGK